MAKRKRAVARAAGGVLCGTLLLWPGAAIETQGGKTFKARLSPVAIDVSMQATVAGAGSATAVLTGTKLALAGTFEGLRSPATVAKVYRGAVTGVPGSAIFDLEITKATSGTISGTITLTPIQVTDLEKGRLYVQLASEKAPDGNLWGWLLPSEGRR